MVDSHSVCSTKRLPKPLCPKISDKEDSYSCQCGFHFKDQIGLQIHQSEYLRVSTHIRPALSMNDIPIPVILMRPNPSAMICDSKPFQCEECRKFFSTEQGFKQHMGKAHSQKRKLAKCPHCDKKFKDKYAVKFHIQQVHEKSNRVYCQLCNIPFYNKYVYQKHVKNCPERIKLRDSYVG